MTSDERCGITDLEVLPEADDQTDNWNRPLLPISRVLRSGAAISDEMVATGHPRRATHRRWRFSHAR